MRGFDIAVLRHLFKEDLREMYKSFALMHMNSVMYRVAFLLGCGNSNNADIADVTGAHKL